MFSSHSDIREILDIRDIRDIRDIVSANVLLEYLIDIRLFECEDIVDVHSHRA